MRHQHWKFIALLAATTVLVAVGILNLLITPPESIALELGLLLIGVVYLATGLFVLVKQTRGAPNYHFFAWSLASFVFYFYISSGEGSQLSRLATFFDGASLALLAPLFLHFCARFLPRSRLVKSKGLAAALYVPALEFALLELLFYARPSAFGASLIQVRGWLDWVERLQYALFLILGITLLVRGFLHETRTDLRQQRRFIAWGLSLSALSFTAFYIIRGASTREVSPLVEAITYSPLVLIPLSFGYSMTGQRLMDVDLILRRSFVSGAAAFAVIAAYTLLVASLGVIIARNAAELASWEGQAATILGMVAMAVLFPPLKNRFQRWTDRWYYGERRKLRADLPRAEPDRSQLDVLIRGPRDQMVEESARRDEEISKLTLQFQERASEIAHITAQVAAEQRPPQEPASNAYKPEIAMKGVPRKTGDISLATIESGSGPGTLLIIQNNTDSAHLEQDLWKGNGLRNIEPNNGEDDHCAAGPARVPDQQPPAAPRPEEPSFFQKYSPRRGF